MELDLKRNDEEGAIEACKRGFEQTEDKKSARAKKQDKAKEGDSKANKRFRLLAEKGDTTKGSAADGKGSADKSGKTAADKGGATTSKGKKQPRTKEDMKKIKDELFKPKKAAPKSKRVAPSHTVDDATKTP